MDISCIKNIYSHMTDEVSKKLYIARLNVSLTLEDSYITDLPDTFKVLNSEILEFKEKLNQNVCQRTVMVGAGFNGQYFAKQLLKGKVFAFIDNYSDEKIEKLNGLPIYRLPEYVKNFGINETRFVISVSNRSASAQILQQLLEFGISFNRIITAPEDYRNNTAQYFDVFQPREHETFVDCGSFDGYSALRFAGWCGRKGYDKVWCFEPDISSMKIVKDNCLNLHDCSVFPYGVSDCEKEVSFVSNGNEDARIENGIETNSQYDIIRTQKLDAILQNERITFIKMDIEGEEYKAIKGAAQIITEQKPRLAISIYHRNEDIVTIPALLLELVPEYKFYLRHYSLLTNETILYAC